MNKLVWTNGLKIDSTLDKNLDGCKERILAKKPSLIIIDGGLGEGKTTLATIIAQRIAYKFNQEFSIKEQVRMGGKEFLKGMKWVSDNKRNVVVYDEAGDFNTRASLTYFNQNMNRVFETYRALGIIVILCLPHFSDSDNSLMKKKIARFLIHCYNRSSTCGQYSVYNLWRMFYLKNKMSKLIVVDDAYKQVSPNFRGRFKNLDKDQEQELEAQSIKGKKEIIKKGILTEKGLTTIQTISEKTGYGIQTIRNFISTNKYKPQEKVGATNYYSANIIQALINRKNSKQ